MSNQNAESLDVSGKTVEEAIEQGLAQIGLSQDEVDVQIIKEGKRGVFGLGAEEALVRLTPRPQQSVRPEPVPNREVTPSKPAETPKAKDEPPDAEPDDVAPREEAPPATPEADADRGPTVEQIAERYLSGLLKHMGIEAEITTRIAMDLVEEGEEPPLALNITGKDLGILIGRRSETLQALQYMVRLMVSKEMTSWQPIVVDVESYRVRRRRSLHRMAEKMAERAISTGKRVVLEAMPAYERRIIHVSLKDHPAVITKSIGSDDNRKVTIIPK
jgi:spoIIIJ-associated protein